MSAKEADMKVSIPTGFVDRWVWACPVLMVLLAASVLWLFGLNWWSAIVAAMLLVCPLLILWGAIKVAWDERRARNRSTRR